MRGNVCTEVYVGDSFMCQCCVMYLNRNSIKLYKRLYRQHIYKG